MRYKLVLFDGYGTLFDDPFKVVREVCDLMSRDHGLGMTPDEFLGVWDKHWFPLIRGETFVTLRESHDVSLAQLFKELGLDADPRTYVAEIFRRFSNSRIYDDVKPALAGLDGVSTGVVSNADEDHLKAALDLNGLSFPVVVSSESARCYKPSPGIFAEALEAFRVQPEDALYVGDSQEDDIVGARAAGLAAAWVNRRGEDLKDEIPDPDYTLTTLGDLPGIVRQGVTSED